MKKTAFFLMIITIISKIVGFIRDITLSYFYGVTNIADAYLISLTIPTVIFSFIGIGISTGYIPTYTSIEQEYGKKEGIRYTNNLVNILLLICTIIVVVSILYTEQIVRVFALGFQGETLTLAIQFTRISILSIYFTGIIYIFSGFLQLKNNYLVPALIGIPMNILIIISLYLSYKTNILILSIGGVIASASQITMLIPFMYKEGYRYKFILKLKDKHIQNMLVMALPIIIGVSVNQINTLVDRTLASNIIEGGISALNYANRLNLFIQGLFVSTIITAIYPIIAKMATENNMNVLKDVSREAINIIIILVVPSTIGAIIFAEPIVKLLFGRGAFDSTAISMTAGVLKFYSIGMIGFGLREVLSRIFYSLQDSKTPMINATIAMLVNIILNLILSKYMGINGLALATSISGIICTILLFINVRKKIGEFGEKEIIVSLFKTILSSLIMGLISGLLYNTLKSYINLNIALIMSIIIGAITYCILIYFSGIKEVDSIIKTLKKKLQVR